MGVYKRVTRGWSGHFHFMIEIILMTDFFGYYELYLPLLPKAISTENASIHPFDLYTDLKIL